MTLCEENIMFWEVSGIGSKVIGLLFFNVQYIIDEYICATCVTTHVRGCLHRVPQSVCLPAGW